MHLRIQLILTSFSSKVKLYFLRCLNGVQVTGWAKKALKSQVCGAAFIRFRAGPAGFNGQRIAGDPPWSAVARPDVR